MSYHTGVIASATPAPELMAAMKTAIDGHAAWTFVETVTVAADVTDIFRCDMAVSGLTKDVHLAVRRTSATGGVYLYLFEDWDAVNKRISKFCVAGATSSLATPQADGSIAGYYQLTPTAWAPSGLPSNYSIMTQTATINTTGFTYYISVQNDAVIMSTTAMAIGNGCAYLGTYLNLFTEALQPRPSLVSGNPIGGNTVSGVNRDVPSVAISYCWAVPNMTNGFLFVNPASSAKDPISNKWIAFPIAVGSYRAGTINGSVRGYIPTSKFKYMMMAEFAENFGDTVTIDGQVHTCFGTSIWVSQAA